MLRVRKLFVLLLVLLPALTACKTAEERAAQSWRAAQRLQAAGDLDRALVELRNALEQDPAHFAARRLYGDLLLQSGAVPQAHAQYLDLVERYPQTADLRRKLALYAIDHGDWSEARRHGGAAIELAPELPEHRGLQVILDYHAARQAGDAAASVAAVARAERLLEQVPGLDPALRVLVDWHGSGPDPARALAPLRALQALHPGALGLWMQRLRLLERLGQEAARGETLRQMQARFPERPEIAAMLVRWYLRQEDAAGAEAVLRRRAGAADAAPEGHLALVEFLARRRGAAAALAELEALAAANAGTPGAWPYRLRAAQLRFEQGARQPALAEAEALLAQVTGFAAEGGLAAADDGAGDRADDMAASLRMTLSRMQAALGAPGRARALVAQVLEADPGHTDALMTRAAWALRGDRVGPAVTDLRRALDQAPRRTDVLLLLAEAQQKLGNLALAERRLAQAVEVSGAAPREALAYARFQMARGAGLASAEVVLTDALRASGDLQVARLLGQLLLRRGAVDEARGVLARIADSDTPGAAPVARALRAAILFSQDRVDESLAVLAAGAGAGEGATRLPAELEMLRIQMLAGRLDQAEARLAGLRDARPEDLGLGLLHGSVLAALERFDEAVAVYRALLERHPPGQEPGAVAAVQRLHGLLLRQARPDEAAALLAAALAERPRARVLRVLRALELERAGAPEAAIPLYEELFAEDPDDLVVANNLASLLSTRAGPGPVRAGAAGEDAGAEDAGAEGEDMARAYRIALRLTGTQRPEFLDTLGWLQLHRGETEAALHNLQLAARGLPQHPGVAFNLALAYAEAGRPEAARSELARGFALAGDDTAVPQLAGARALAARLEGGQ